MHSALLDKIRGIVGAESVLTGVELSPYVLEGRTPAAAVFPGSVEEVGALLALASDEGIAVIPGGGGTKIAIGAPPKRLGRGWSWRECSPMRWVGGLAKMGSNR